MSQQQAHTETINSLRVHALSGRWREINLKTGISCRVIAQDILLEVALTQDDFEKVRLSINNTNQAHSSLSILKTLRDKLSSDYFSIDYDKRAEMNAYLREAFRGTFPDDSEIGFRILSLLLRYLNGDSDSYYSSPIYINVTAPDGTVITGIPSGKFEFKHIIGVYTKLISTGPRRGYEAKWEAKKNRATKCIENLTKAADMHYLGHAVSSIAGAIQIQDKILTSYFNGSMPRPIVHLENASMLRKSHNEPSLLRIFRVENIPLAYILGCYQAVTNGGGMLHKISVRSTLQNSVVAFERNFNAINLFPKNGKVHEVTIGGQNYFEFRIHNDKLTSELAKITSSGEKLPWEYLGTDNEIKAYLQGYLSLRGSFKEDALIIQGINRDECIISLAALFEHLGVTPLVTISDKSLLRISSKDNLLKLLNLGILGEHQASQISTYVTGHTIGKDMVRAYYTAMRNWRSTPRPLIKDIALDIGVHAGTVREWLVAGLKPREVMHFEKLIELKTKYKIPNLKVSAYAFRELGFNSKDCRELAELATLDQVKKACSNMHTQGIDKIEINHLIRLLSKQAA